MLSSAQRILAARPALRLAALAGGFGLVASIFRPGAPEHDIGALAAALGESIDGAVAPSDVHWEPAEGAIADYVHGRWVVFLGAARVGEPRDVWRARVRLTPEGRPLEVLELHDLTCTPLGDDHGLVVRGWHAAFATFAYGQVQSVTSLDLAGERAPQIEHLADRAMAVVTNVQQTGTAGGVGRVDVTLDPPASRVALRLEDVRPGARPRVVLDLTYPNGTRHGVLDSERAEVEGTLAGLHVEEQRHLPKRPIFWAVDTVRAVPWIGARPIAWLEEKVFALKDMGNKLAFKAGGADATLADVSRDAAGTPTAAQALDTSKASADDGAWPPPNVASIWKKTEPGEGVWVVPKTPWLKRLGPDAPPPFLRTFVRPDQERPYAQVTLVALDMRQLDLDMEAGSEDPKPLVGANGPGRIPRDSAIYPRVVAAFNGGFKTEHGNYGMMVKKRVLLPPQPSAATVTVLRDGRVGFGTWPNTHEVTGLQDIADSDILSFRQNLDPLVDRGEVNPNKRGLWGWTMPGTGVQTERSGVCTTAAGHVIYGWGDDLSATALGKALQAAGCVYALHLDMNPHHTGFVFAAIDELKGRKYKSELLSPQMTIQPDRYIEYAPKDFFYALLHDPTPAKVEGLAWQPDPGAQPAPSWMPGLWSAKAGADGAIEVLDVEVGRAGFRIRGGAREPDARTGGQALSELSPEDGQRVLFATGLGVAEDKRLRGLATGGKMVMPVHGGSTSAVLMAAADGALSIVRPDEAAGPPAGADLVELPLLLDKGERVATPATRSGAGARAALGITSEGRVLLARGDVDSDALADVLRRGGCTRAVLLDRGAHASAFVHRAGTPSAPRARYDVSVLYALARPMRPRAFRFEPQATLAQAK